MGDLDVYERAQRIRAALAEAGFSDRAAVTVEGSSVSVNVWADDESPELRRAIWRAFFLTGSISRCVDCLVNDFQRKGSCDHPIVWG